MQYMQLEVNGKKDTPRFILVTKKTAEPSKSSISDSRRRDLMYVNLL